MSFAKNVHRYYKYVLGVIVAIMALSLVISGNVTPGGRNPERTIATIYGTFPVTQKDWIDASARAAAYYRWKCVDEIDHSSEYNDVAFRDYLFKAPYGEGPGLLATHEMFRPSGEDVIACARELIILGFDARAKSIRVSDEEVEDHIAALLRRARVPLHDVDKQEEFAQVYFLAKPDVFKETVREALLIDKALTLDVAGSNVRYEDVFRKRLADSRSIRVLTAGIDSETLPGDIVPVTDDEVRTEFDRRREVFKMPEKAQLEYLMADFEEFKTKRIKDPTPEEIGKYYEEHKREFTIASPRREERSPQDRPDPEPQEPKFQPLEEVREQIVKKIKDREASTLGYRLISTISSKDYADEEWKVLQEEKGREPKDDKAVRERVLARTGSIFASIRDKYRAQGIELSNGITLPFDSKSQEAVEKAIGKPTSQEYVAWAFGNPVGQVANLLYRSEKGVALIRIANKIEGYAPDLSGPVREKIRGDLLQERVKGRAQALADQLVRRIQEKGPAEVAKLQGRRDIQIQRSGYITSKTADNETGLKPSQLSQQVKNQFLAANKNPDADPAAKSDKIEASTVAGHLVGSNWESWAFVIVVEDAVQVPPDPNEDEFLRDVRTREMDELVKSRTARAAQLVASAEWKEAAPVKSED
ncbi:MAG TPA: hypothetical protein VGK61_03420 [Planctomycetota bacterium]